MEYLGHKANLLSRVTAAVEGHRRSHLRVLDAFSGTAAVSRALRARGHVVHANDQLELCTVWARAALLVPRQPQFRALADRLGHSCLTYEQVVDLLNGAMPTNGFMTRHYSPASFDVDGVERRYFTYQNAKRIDGARRRIADWSDWLAPEEESLLIATLVAATMDVSNTAGTYGCYLKSWKSTAVRPLELRPLQLSKGQHEGHIVTRADAAEVASEADVDVIYADPPYTKRQYAAYYHVLETLVRDDQPPLTGSTGLRDWRAQASDWCYARRAPAALEALVAKSSAPRFVLSYNADGHISHDQVMDVLAAWGRVTVTSIKQRRYRSSRGTHRGAFVTESIYVLARQ